MHNLLSKYCSDITNNYKIKIDNVNKFVPNLGNKSKYLHLCLYLGIKLVNIHRILKFKQLDWLKIYTDLITDKRNRTAISFDADE